MFFFKLFEVLILSFMLGNWYLRKSICALTMIHNHILGDLTGITGEKNGENT